jgi:hypothetical protein
MLPVERLLEEIRAFAAHKVAEGFDGGEQIIDQTLALFVSGEAYNPSYFCFSTQEEGKSYQEQELRPHVERITADLLEERRRLESEWAEPTDCDKLDWAFDELNRCGIIARQNLPCCMACARAEIGYGQGGMGYAFYHEQDTARAPDGGLLLAFGSPGGGEDQTVRVGARIVKELNRFGLRTEWSGSTDDRILVPLEWKKRRFSSCPRRTSEPSG